MVTLMAVRQTENRAASNDEFERGLGIIRPSGRDTIHRQHSCTTSTQILLLSWPAMSVLLLQAQYLGSEGASMIGEGSEATSAVDHGVTSQ